MSTIITREVGVSAKGAPLTNAELDQNFINLNTAIESSAQLVTDAAGNVTGLVGPGGRTVLNVTPPRTAGMLDLLPVDDATHWVTDKTAALVVTVDSTVLFEGRPTLKITIPAGTSGTCKIGCSGANARLPYVWDRKDFAIVTKTSGFTGYNMTSTFPPKLVAYVADATYTNFWTINGFDGANFPEQKPRQDEWNVCKPPVSAWATGSGTPLSVLGDGTNITSAMARTKLQWTQVSQATDCYIWIGFVGKMPKRPKPTIIWTIDDGYASWYSFVAPLMRHYDMPISMAIDSLLVGTANYMTAAQIQEMYQEPECLFDFVNHGQNNQSYNTLGAAAYYQTLQATKAYLQGLGIEGDGPMHHAYVQSVWGNDLVDLLDAGGYLSARASTYAATHGKDQLIESDKLRWHLNVATNLTNTKTLAQANTDIDTVVTNGGFGMINAHDFGPTADATYKWSYADMQQFVGRIASLRDAGTIEVKSWSRWYADLTGRHHHRR